MNGALTVLAESPARGGKLELVHRAAGYQPAGSVARYDGEAWGSIFTCRYDGTTHGQWYAKQEDARERFAKVAAANAA